MPINSMSEADFRKLVQRPPLLPRGAKIPTTVTWQATETIAGELGLELQLTGFEADIRDAIPEITELLKVFMRERNNLISRIQTESAALLLEQDLMAFSINPNISLGTIHIHIDRSKSLSIEISGQLLAPTLEDAFVDIHISRTCDLLAVNIGS